MEGVEPRMDHVPSLGEHTPAILEELGFGRDLIATWKKDAVI
jgi:crotonobetainyl-CoA:carnitine CoA-transferase CaiB-like acyl-CoA transferase